MSDQTPLETGGIVAVVIGVLSFGKYMVGKALNAKREDRMDDLSAKVDQIHALATKVDGDGTPLVYAPRSWGDVHQRISETCQNISATQLEIAKTLERIERRMNEPR